MIDLKELFSGKQDTAALSLRIICGRCNRKRTCSIVGAFPFFLTPLVRLATAAERVALEGWEASAVE